ncbi:MAG: ABC transporter permease, partial [Acutalibacteraceae bacterium]
MLNIVKKEEPSRGRELLTRLIAVVAALAATGLIMVFLGLNPFTVYVKMVEGATGTSYRLQETINKTIPLLVLSLGTAVAFKMKFWNIGAEGQFYMGAFGAAGVA